MNQIRFRGELYNCIEVEPNEEFGFNFPFMIIIPNNLNEKPNLVYACNLPKPIMDECSSFEEVLLHTKKDLNSIDPIHIHLFRDLGNPLLIPFVPKTKEFRPNFLGEDIFNNDFSKAIDFKFKEELPRYNNLIDQHKNMIDYGVKMLKENEIDVPDKVIMAGYSEGSKFASHFALIHPECLNAVILGGTAGATALPISEYNGYTFNYPIGVSNIPNFDFEAYKQISFFEFQGEEDISDPALPKFEIYHYTENGEDKVLVDEGGNKSPFKDGEQVTPFLLDENGNYTAMYNLFSDDTVNSLNKAFGTRGIDRFKKQNEIFDNLGLNAEFHMYPGNHRTVFDNKEQIFNDLDIFLGKNLDKSNHFIK